MRETREGALCRIGTHELPFCPWWVLVKRVRRGTPPPRHRHLRIDIVVVVGPNGRPDFCAGVAAVIQEPVGSADTQHGIGSAERAGELVARGVHDPCAIKTAAIHRIEIHSIFLRKSA